MKLICTLSVFLGLVGVLVGVGFVGFKNPGVALATIAYAIWLVCAAITIMGLWEVAKNLCSWLRERVR